MGAIYPKRRFVPVVFRQDMSAVVLRQAEPGDDVAIGELLVEAFVSTYERKMPEVTVTAQRKADLRDVAAKRALGAEIWVAEREGRVVGTVTVWRPGAARSEAWVKGAADLRQLAVSGAVRGSGVSTLLMDHAESWVRAQGYPGVCLHVRRGAGGVRSVYEKRGYQRRPEGDLDLLPDVFLEAFYLPLD